MKFVVQLMGVDIPNSILLAFGLAIVFFYLDYSQKGPKLQKSFLAGVSMSYFFLVVLPEISLNLPEIPHHLENFRFAFILWGFVFVHLSEKFIFQSVAKESERRAKELDEREFNLSLVENSISDFLTSGISQDQLDLDAVKELNNIVMSLNQNHDEILRQIKVIKHEIEVAIDSKVEKLQELLKFLYHFLVGAILMGLMQIDLLAGSMFFVFAFFMALLSNKSHEKQNSLAHNHQKRVHIILASSVLLGAMWDILINLVVPISLSLLYVSFSFTSGVILYNIMLRVIPKDERDRPVYFIIGFVSFAVFIFSINIFAHRFI
jgi:hypothetical protein